MSGKGFGILLACLRFDTNEEIMSRVKTDPVAAISHIFEKFCHSKVQFDGVYLALWIQNFGTTCILKKNKANIKHITFFNYLNSVYLKTSLK